jgi:2-dehydropantoate 2-reductase
MHYTRGTRQRFGARNEDRHHGIGRAGRLFRSAPKGGANVTFSARGAHLAAMREQGLSVEGGPEPVHVSPVNATDDPINVGICDLVFLAVKLWDTDA